MDLKWVGDDRLVTKIGIHRVNPRSNALFSLGAGVFWIVAWTAIILPNVVVSDDLGKMLAIYVALMLVGGYLTYGSLAYLFNHTRMSIKNHVLSVQTRPFPFRPKRVLRCSEIHSFDAETIVKRGMNKTTWPVTILQVYTLDGEKIALLKQAGDHLTRFKVIAQRLHSMVIADNLKTRGIYITASETRLAP